MARRAAAGISALGIGMATLAGDGPPCPYTVTVAGTAPNCGFWGYSYLQPTAINNLGHWVGYRNKCPDNESLYQHAIRWTPETGLEILPVPSNTTSAAAYAINDLGTVVGWRVGTTDGQFHGYWACIWLPNGEFVEIPPLGGTPPHSWATAVNNKNVVVGWRNGLGGTSAARYAFIWHDGQVTDLDPLPFGSWTAEARDVSDTGYIVGQFGSDSNGSSRGFRWKDDAVEILQPLPGAVTSTAMGVTETGIVFGQSRFGSGAGVTHRLTMWALDGLPVELPSLPGYPSWGCKAVNGSGVVLGLVAKQSQPGLWTTEEVVWIDGVPYAIKPLVSAPVPSQYSGALAINDLGQLVCRASTPPGGGAWILTPTGSSADLNGDCVVDGTDLGVLLQQWGAVPGAPASADLDGDGEVDGRDLGILLGAWTG
ncbi:MAG: dockerin type I domain-containing protein [Phycisphaerales bacterium]